MSIELDCTDDRNFSLSNRRYDRYNTSNNSLDIVSIKKEKLPLNSSLLPKYQKKISDYINNHHNMPCVLVTGGTGAGKSAQVPRLVWWYTSQDVLYNYTIIIVMPRKVLINNAFDYLLFRTKFNGPIAYRRFSEAENEYYSFREFAKGYTPYSKIIFTVPDLYISTVSILQQEDPSRKVIALFDEIHEHIISTDIGISYSKHNSIPIILMTATPKGDRGEISKFFGYLGEIDIGENTKKYKIKVVEDLSFDEALKKIRPKKGEIGLVIVSTKMEIIKCRNNISRIFPEAICVSLYSGSDTDINAVPGKVKLIVSTPIVESGITIDNATVVYDFGKYLTIKFFTPIINNISESMMIQRMGRVGRTSNGTYVKLFKQLSPPLRQVDTSLVFQFVFTEIIYGIKQFFSGPSANRMKFGRTYIKNLGRVNWVSSINSYGMFPLLPDMLLYNRNKQINKMNDNELFLLALKINIFSYKGILNKQLDYDKDSLKFPIDKKFTTQYLLERRGQNDTKTKKSIIVVSNNLNPYN